MKQSLCRSLRRDAHWKCLILTMLISGCLAAIGWCHLHILRGLPPPPSPSPPPSSSSLTPASSSSLLSLSSSSPSSSTFSAFSSTVVAPSQPYTSSQGDERPESKPKPDGSCEEGYVYIPVAFVVMLYLVYLVECWHSHTRIDLQCKVDINAVYDKIHDMREGVPIIWWKAICYHYVRRTRQITRYRNGDAFTSTQVYYERINTCTAGSAFNFTQCGVKDISRSLLGLEHHPATKIRFSKGFSFASVESECEFEEQRSQFFQEYEARDDYMEGREGMDILNVNFKEHMLAFADLEHLPWYLSHLVFWVASFLLLSWPLRVVIEYRTAHLHFHVHKLFGVNYVDVAETLRRRGTLTRVSTMNSADMEMNIRNNNFMAPSYSDALLMMSAARRPSVMSVMTTSAGGGLRNSLSICASRSATRSTLHTSGSGTFIPGSLPSVPMTTIRRFHSCTAIHLNGDGKAPCVPLSPSGNIFTAHLLRLRLGGQSSTALCEESAADTGMDRRKWRRKRPTSSVTFCGSFLSALLPPTLESAESTFQLCRTPSPRSTTLVTHFNTNTNTITTTANDLNPQEEDTASVVALRPSRTCLGDVGSSGSGFPRVRSSRSMTLSSTGGGITGSVPSEGDAPPAYSDALGMPRLQQTDRVGLRIVRDHRLGLRMPADGDGWRVRRLQGGGGGGSGLRIVNGHQPFRLHDNGETGGYESFINACDDQPHGESVRLLSRTKEAGFYGSMGHRLDQNSPANSTGSVTGSRQSHLYCDINNACDEYADDSVTSPIAGQPGFTSTPFSPQGLPAQLYQDRDECQGASSSATGSEISSPQYHVSHHPSHQLMHPKPHLESSYQSSQKVSAYQTIHATLRSQTVSGDRTRSEIPNPTPLTQINRGLPPSAWGCDPNKGSNPAAFPFVLSPCRRMDVDRERGKNSASQSGIECSPTLLPRLPTVVSPCWTLSDEEDLSPVHQSASWSSLAGSTASLTGCDETQSLGVGGIDNPTSVSPSLFTAASAAAASVEQRGVVEEEEAVDSIPLQARGVSCDSCGSLSPSSVCASCQSSEAVLSPCMETRF